MQLEILKDDDGAIVGFSIESVSPDESVNDDIISIVQNFHDGVGQVKVVKSQITLTSPENEISFEVCQPEALIIEKYLAGIATGKTSPSISIKQRWTTKASFMFKNEQVRQESLKAQTKA